jgi:hypothetical protein
MPANESLVQILLPLRDNAGRPFADDAHGRTRRELLDRFGGVTAYQRAPAEGLWKSEAGEVDRDEVVIFEVMVDEVERDWWRQYRETLQARFRQDVIVIRAIPHEML